MRLPGALVIAAALAAFPAELSAQAIVADSGPGACRPEVIGRDSVMDTIFAWLPSLRRDENRDEYQLRYAQAQAALAMLEAGLILESSDSPEVNAPLPPPPPPGAEQFDDADVLVWFQVRDNGRLAGIKVERRSRWRALDLALQRAVLRADSLGALQPLPGSLAGRPVDLWLAAGIGRTPDGRNVPVARLRRIDERYRGGETPARFLRTAYRPRFPEAAMRQGVSDSLLMEFVVDPAGVPIPASIRTVRTGFREYADEAARAIRASRFAPARRGHCAVAARVRLPISFVNPY